MTDPRWDDVRDIFVQPGRDTAFRIVDTTTSSWQALLDLIRSRQWRHEYGEDGVAVTMPDQAQDILDRAEDTYPTVWVWPTPVLLVVFEPVAAEEVRFGIDLRQVQGQERLEGLFGFIRTIGQLLNRPVLMAPDGDWDTDPADLAYRPEVDRVVILRPPTRPR